MDKKKWIMGGSEYMWSCGTCNLPNNGDIVVDTHGKEWKVRVNGGYQLVDSDGNCHQYTREPLDWMLFCGWFNDTVREEVK